MATFSTAIQILASPEAVWESLADIGSIDRWNPGVRDSYLTGSIEQGPGAARYCDLGGGNYLQESVIHWEPGRQLSMQVSDTNLPFQSVDIHFNLKPGGDKTLVTLTPVYRLKFGLLGVVLDLLYVRRTYRRGMEALLLGLKNDVERRSTSGDGENPPGLISPKTRG